MRPLSIRETPRPGGAGGPSTGSANDVTILSQTATYILLRAILSLQIVTNLILLFICYLRVNKVVYIYVLCYSQYFFVCIYFNRMC